MQKLHRLIIVFLLMLGFLSCQDKYLMGYVPAAKGSLKSESTGDCLPKTIAGTYSVGKELNDTNYIEVTVNVKSTGTYSIKTNTVNGYSFSTSGTFTTIGINTVKLFSKGKPANPQTDDLTVSFDTSVCHIKITVLPAAGLPALFSLAGAPFACSNAVVTGVFAKGAATDTFGKVSIVVNVISIGSYSVSTNTVNGYKFSATGNFTVTGVQIIILTPSGAPLNAGVDDFTLNGVSSSCGFSVTVVNPVPLNNNDHFPLTGNSYWTYDDLYNTGDTLKKYIPDSLTLINGNNYRVMYEQPKFGNPVPSVYRKDADNYYEYISADKYTLSVKFNPQINADFPFIKESLKTGDTWTSDEYIGTATFGQQIFLRYDFTCDNADAKVTFKGNTFSNVYKITMRPKLKSATTYPYESTSEIVNIWYAKGIGVIYYRKINNGFTIYEYQIRNWLIK